MQPPWFRSSCLASPCNTFALKFSFMGRSLDLQPPRPFLPSKEGSVASCLWLQTLPLRTAGRRSGAAPAHSLRRAVELSIILVSEVLQNTGLHPRALGPQYHLPCGPFQLGFSNSHIRSSKVWNDHGPAQSAEQKPKPQKGGSSKCTAANSKK